MADTVNLTSDLAKPSGLTQRLIGARIRSDWQYRTSFFTLLFSQVLIVSLEFAAIVLLLRLVPDLGGWTTTEVVFLYALSVVPFAIADATISSVERLADYVREGTFDRLLLRPLPAIFQLVVGEFQLRRFGKLVPALGVGVWAVANVEIEWTAARIGVLVAAVICGVTIYAALWVMTASLSFWAVASKEATNSVTYGGQAANQYPLHLYRNWIRATLGWGVPLAFVSYVPSQWLLDADNPLGLSPNLVFATPLVAVALTAIASFCWRLGIRHYQSTGS